jgi:signal transduction histidine kinase
MSENERTSRAKAEQSVVSMFETAGYEVSQTVGTQPGEVDWFARPKTGLERPITYWQIWEKYPLAIDDALLALEKARRDKGADRALAVISGTLPTRHKTDLRGQPTNIITVRRLLIELSGLTDKVRAQRVRYEAEKKPSHFLPRRGRTSSGEIVDAVMYTKAWLEHGESKNLAILARPHSGRANVIERVAYELSLDFEDDPENANFLILQGATSSSRNSRYEASTFNFSNETALTVSASDLGSDGTSGKPQSAESTLELLDPTDSDVESWFETQSLAPEVLERFRSARREVAEFRSLSNAVPNLSLLLAAMRGSLLQTSKTVNEWTAEVVSDYVRTLLLYSFDDMYYLAPGKSATRKLLDDANALDDAAFQQFALGRPSASYSVRDVSLTKPLDAALSTWLIRGANTHVTVEGTAESQKLIEGFANILIRDYFVARKVEREMLTGSSAILGRYQFPKDYVLLFLAILSPSAVAQATAERSSEIRAEIEDEVERRLQLTLAHQLKRSAGAVRASLRSIQKTIQKKMKPEDAEALHYDIGRIDEEAVFQSALAEQTRLLGEVPEGTIESLALAEHVLSVVEPLRERYVGVRCEVSIESSILIRANRTGIKEILHGLIENAFHAAPLGKSEVPLVRVVAVPEGKSTRLDVIDSGPGIRPEDRERIFELYVTTKKGGDQPLGTGMGLVIARRYAQRIGARVEIATERQETCFFIRFVTGEEKV